MKTTVAKSILSISTKDRLYIEKINAAILSKPRFIAVAGYEADNFRYKRIIWRNENKHSSYRWLSKQLLWTSNKNWFDVSNIGTWRKLS